MKFALVYCGIEVLHLQVYCAHFYDFENARACKCAKPDMSTERNTVKLILLQKIAIVRAFYIPNSLLLKSLSDFSTVFAQSLHIMRGL